MKKIKVGIIGFGNSGRTFHAPLILANPGYEVEMVSSSRPEAVKELIPKAVVAAEVGALFKNESLDLIVNCAPNSFHFSYTRDALASGKHVVVEKPFVNEVSEGAKLIEIAKEKNRVLSVFHSRRFDSDFLTIKKLIAGGALGEIKQFESHFDRYRPNSRLGRWREQAQAGSGIFYDLGAHLIDQALELFGMPEKIFADIEVQKPDALIDDYFHVIFYYGKMRVILHSNSYSPVSPRFQIFGEQATFVKYGIDPQEHQLKAGMNPEDAKFGVEDVSLYGTFADSQTLAAKTISSERGNYAHYYEMLYQAIVNGGKLPVQASEALQTIQLIELSLKSAKLGKALPVPN